MSSSRDQQMNPVTVGIIGSVVLVTAMAIAFRFDKLPVINAADTVSADFAEIGGLRSGDEVLISGTKVGEVGDIELDGGKVRVDAAIEEADVRLGRQTTARIVTVTLLGKTALQLDPAGTGSLDREQSIPLSRTSAPYDITQALEQLTTETQEIDSGQLTEALGTISGTIKDTPQDLQGAVRGLTKVAEAIDDHDKAFGLLLDRSKDVSGILADRNAEIATLLKSGDSLLAQLNAREQAVVSLLEDTTALSRQLSALVKENRKVLKPALVQLNRAVDQLNDNKRNLELTLDGLASYTTELGEAVSSGPFFDAYVQNLTSPQTVAPVLSGFLQ